MKREGLSDPLIDLNRLDDQAIDSQRQSFKSCSHSQRQPLARSRLSIYLRYVLRISYVPLFRIDLSRVLAFVYRKETQRTTWRVNDAFAARRGPRSGFIARKTVTRSVIQDNANRCPKVIVIAALLLLERASRRTSQSKLARGLEGRNLSRERERERESARVRAIRIEFEERIDEARES